MAGMDFIDDARTTLEERILELSMIVQTMWDLTSGDNVTPSWLEVIYPRFQSIDEAAQAYMMAVHEHARPVLKMHSAGVQPARIEPGEADA